MLHELRIALRQWRNAPGTAIAAVVTLAVGIGATTAVYSFVTALWSVAAPAPDMERLVGLWTRNRGEAETKSLASSNDYREWSRRAESFAAMAAWRGATFNVSWEGAASRESAQLVTPEYLAIFGWRPLMGRDFTTADATPGAAKVIIISDAFWRNRLGGRPDIIGLTLSLDREPASVIGVLPPLPGVTNFLVPLAIDERATDLTLRSLFVFARLAPGISIEAARAEMEAIGAALEREWPTSHRGWTTNVRPLQEEFLGPQARLVFMLLVAIVSAVLLIGCVNIANLLLARGAARRGELALRLALGAGAWRVTRQLLLECAVLACAGGLASLVISHWTLRILRSLGDVDSPWVTGGVNMRLLMLTALVAAVATIAAGLAPALAARRTDLDVGVRAIARSRLASTRKTTRVLVAIQVSLAVALLVAAGLATRTLLALERLNPGFDIDNVLTASVTLPETMTPESTTRWVERGLDEMRRIPGALIVGATTRLPFAGSRWNPNRGLVIEGQAVDGSDEGRWAVDYAVTPGLLETLRIPLRAGRNVTEADGPGAPLVAIVSETLARRFWAERSPLGARLRQGDEPEGTWRTVVGVVGDIRNDDADQPPVPYLYMPLAQQPARTVTFTLRTASNPAAYAAQIRAAVASFDPEQPLYDIRTMRAVWEQDLHQTRVLIQVIGALSLVALGLAGLGVWGVAAQAVGQRTREIGLRMALGARAGQVSVMIARQVLAPIVLGLCVGLSAGLALAQGMRSILFQVTPTDPMTIVLTLAALLAVAVLATLGPALRAARLDPLTALRVE
jgi:putative ABC transport system permease protein